MADSQAHKSEWSQGLNEDSDWGLSFPPFFWAHLLHLQSGAALCWKGASYRGRLFTRLEALRGSLVFICIHSVTVHVIFNPSRPQWNCSFILRLVDNVILFFWWHYWQICWAARVERRELHLVAAHFRTGWFQFSTVNVASLTITHFVPIVEPELYFSLNCILETHICLLSVPHHHKLRWK